MRINVAGSLIVLALGGLVTGCAETEPYERPGQWQPLGANAANLRAMVADPRDLAWGNGAATSSGDIAAAAVTRLRSGTTKRLPASAVSDLRPTDSGEGPAPADTPSAVGAAAPGNGP